EGDKGAATAGVQNANGAFGQEYLTDATIIGALPAIMEMEGVTILTGRFINATDIAERRKTIVIDKIARDVLFGDQDLIGQRIRVKETSYSVVGVYEQNSFSQNSVCYIPLSTAQLIYRADDPSISQATFTVEGIRTDAQMEAFEQRVRQRLAAEHDYSPDDESAIWLYNRMENYKQMMLVFGGVNLFIWIIGLGTLLAGVVGVSNIMLVTVQERTFEFGIRKALGAKPSSIIRLILTESVLITAAFGYIGMVLGVFIMEAVNKVLASGGEGEFSIFRNPTLDLSVAFSATLVLVLAGLIAGYIPARRAARLKTIDALRHNK
ncbi:MAG: FtsX-like permease family protein, partial [Alistipes sp.]|nr:FtsX-like permease family protein [Alistipes sp.]